MELLEPNFFGKPDTTFQVFLTSVARQFGGFDMSPYLAAGKLSRTDLDGLNGFTLTSTLNIYSHLNMAGEIYPIFTPLSLEGCNGAQPWGYFTTDLNGLDETRHFLALSENGEYYQSDYLANFVREYLPVNLEQVSAGLDGLSVNFN